jgi:uncharacterized protein with beta-barrel porin domain
MRMTSMRARRPLLALASACALAGTCLLSGAARAQCVQTLLVVDCSGDVSTGFVAMPGENGLQMTIRTQPFFRNTTLAAGEASLTLNDANSVNVLGGVFLSNGLGLANTNAVMAGNGNLFQIGDGLNVTQVFANGANARGLLLGDGNAVIVQLGANVSSVLGSGVAIEAGSGNLIDNTGEITAGTLAPAGGTAIRLTGGNNLIDNFNRILAQTGGTAIQLMTPAGTTNEVDNERNSIIASQLGFAIVGGDGQDVVSNLGGIFGDIALGNGNDSIVNFQVIEGVVDLGGGDDLFSQVAGASFVGTLDGGAGTDTLLLDGADQTSAPVDLGVFSNFEQLGVIGGTWLMSGTSASLTSTVLFAGVLAPQGTVNVSGSYAQLAGSTYQVRLLGQNQSDTMAFAGAATIGAGSRLLLVPAGSFDDSSVFTILSAAGGVTGQFDAPPAISAVLTPTQVLLPNAIQIVIARLPYSAPATSPNQRATGAALDSIRAAGATGDMANVLQQLDLLPTGRYQIALDQLHPEAYDAETSRMIWRGRSFAEAALARRPDCGPVPWPSGPEVVAASPCGASGWTPWLASWGEFGERDGGAGHIDYDNLGGDLAIGADRRLGDRWLLTGYVGAGGSDIDVTGTANATLYSAEVGAAVGFQAGPLGVRAAGAYGHGWHHTRRDIAVGNVIRSAYSSHGSDRLNGTLEGGWTFDLAPFFVEPLASVDWTWIQQDSIDETGAGSLSLAVDSRSDSVLSSTAGVRVGTTFYKHGYAVDWLEWADGVWRPELSLRWREIWTGRERDLTSRLTGAPAQAGTFTVSGRDAQRGAEAGLRVMFQPEGTDVQVGLGYDGFYGDGTFNHFVGIQLRVPIP